MAAFTEENLISPQAADKLIMSHDAEVALLYLYLLRSGNDDPEEAAKALCRTIAQISDAMEKLQRMELDAPALSSEVKAATPAAPANAAVKPLIGEVIDQLPEYEAKDVVRLASSDSGFAAVMNEAKTVLGSAFNTGCQKTLVGLYSHLGLPAEVLMELLHFCAAQCEIPGSRKRLTMRIIEKEAFVWARMEIFTLDMAEKYIESRQSRNAAAQRIKEVLGISGRELTKTERESISRWLDMGYGEEEIGEAFDRTVTNTGKLSWNYMDKIISSWYENGIKTMAEIAEKDSRRSPRKKPSRAVSDDETPVNMDELNRYLDQMK